MATNIQHFLQTGQGPFGLTKSAFLGLLALSAAASLVFLRFYGFSFAAKIQSTFFPSRAPTKSKFNSKSCSDPDPKTQFPPSRRDVLFKAAKANPTAAKYAELLKAKGLKSGPTTATGFSEADIKALGRFPDYSVLSGVPNPKPCPDFNIKTACLRPYRPFRWTYHQTMILFDNVPEDFPMMIRDCETGVYHLRAGFICSSIGWTFGTHFGRPLAAIHTEVNDYDKMARSMDRYFTKMPTDAPIQRGAWFIDDWKPLFVTPEEYALNSGACHSNSDNQVPIEQCYLRVDWQTLRWLLLSGAIVFNFKAIFTPVTEMRDKPYIPSLLYKQVMEGKRLITEPKVHRHLLPVVLGKLKEWRGEQEDKGLIVKDWDEETLKESPFYPGWKGRWRERVGFSI
ncbi:heme-dependent oxidative N-demethylase family protein [Aspergillus stella-maris]|uniref:heme-dependent oxidative N-demethylase family protein n=1 Tax=Aspergillus stella-maris TaxID=1810926 RepID=UPI003CCDBB76